MDADDELKDIKLGFRSWRQYAMGTPSGHISKPEKKVDREKGAYEKACEEYGIAPCWTVEGQNRLRRLNVQ